MRIVKVPRVNALGHVGPAEAPDLIVAELEKNKGVTGDVSSVDVDNSDVETAEKVIYAKAREVFVDVGREKTAFIGGDHSISSPIVRAFNEKFSEAFLIVFDAHADCMPPMKEATHEEWLRAVIESGFNPENVILIGARKIEAEEWRFLIENGVKVFWLLVCLCVCVLLIVLFCLLLCWLP